MTATGHAVLGTVIAVKIGNPALAIPIAFVSHIFADLLPHWDAGTHGEKKKKSQLIFEAAADVLISFLTMYLLIRYLFPATDLLYAFIVVLAAQGLDWLTAPYYFFGIKMQPFTFFHNLSSSTNTKLDKPWGIVSQIMVSTIALAFALK